MAVALGGNDNNHICPRQATPKRESLVPSFPGAKAVPLARCGEGMMAMANLVQYRCYFLDSTGSIGTDEMIECLQERDAVETARDMLEHRPHYHGIELWRGARRVHMEVRLPDVPAFTIRTSPSF